MNLLDQALVEHLRKGVSVSFGCILFNIDTMDIQRLANPFLEIGIKAESDSAQVRQQYIIFSYNVD